MSISGVSVASSAAYVPLSQAAVQVAGTALAPAQLAAAQQYAPAPVTPQTHQTSQYHHHHHRHRGDDVASASASGATQSGTNALDTFV